MFNPFKLEQDLQKLTVDANRARQTLEEQMIEFERKKMEDIKVNFDKRENNPCMKESLFEGGRVENFVTCFVCTYPAIRGHFPKVRTVHFEINQKHFMIQKTYQPLAFRN